MKKLQYQLSNGNWTDVDDERINEFLDMCVANTPDCNSRDEAVALMEAGRELRNAPEDWYSNCRMFDREEYEKQLREMKKAEYERNKKRLRCKSCGQTGFAGTYPFSTLSGSGYCDDCC